MFQFVEDIQKIARNCNDILRYSYDDRQYMERQFKAVSTKLKQIGEKMNKTDEAVDQLISVVRPLIESSRALTAALDAANGRAIALAAELAEFKATDAEEDARQLAAQDDTLAASVNDKAAKLAADIAAIQNPPKVEEPAAEPEAPASEQPAAEPAPAEGELPAVVVDEPVVVVPGEEAPAPADGTQVTEDASVVVSEEGVAAEDLGAGDPAVITPEVNTQPEDVAPSARRRR